MRSPADVARVGAGLFTDVARARRGVPSRASTYRAVRTLHDLTGGRSSRSLHAAYRVLPGWVDAVDRHQAGQLRQLLGRPCDELERDGLTMIDPVLDDRAIASLRRFAETAPGVCIAGGSSVPGTFRDAPDGTTGILLDGSFVWARPEIQAAMINPAILDLAVACFGARPVIHPPRLVWSVPSEGDEHHAERRQLARRFHSDFDGLRALRVHVYLTDVDEGAAPMDYVRGSHRPGVVPVRLRRRYGDDLPAPIVEDRFDADALTTITGPAGTTFVSDSQGLHRANRARTAARLFLVIPVQVGSLAGAYSRRRAIPVTDERFGAALDAGDPALRLFERGAPSRIGPPVAVMAAAARR